MGQLPRTPACFDDEVHDAQDSDKVGWAGGHSKNLPDLTLMFSGRRETHLMSRNMKLIPRLAYTQCMFFDMRFDFVYD